MSKIPEVKTRKRKYKNGTVSYGYLYEGPEIQGKRNQIQKMGFDTEKEALEAGIIDRNNLYRYGNSVTQKAKGDISVSDFIMNVWYPARCKQRNWQETTRKNYEKISRVQIGPAIGKYPVQSITIEILQDLLDDMYENQGYSHNSVSNLHGLLCNIFRYAKEHGYIEELFLDDLVVPKKDEDVEYEREAHRYQVRDVIPSDALDRIFERFPEGSSAYLPMMISLFTGCRLSEVFGLAWEDIDFENNFISVERQFLDDRVFYICNPKYNSKRKVPICPTLREMLVKERTLQLENEKKEGVFYRHYYLERRASTEDFKNKHGIRDITEEPNDMEIHFVNVYPDGKFKTPSIMKHASRIIHGYSSYLKSPKKKNKVNPIFNDFNMHSFRHTFASALNDMDMDPMLLSAVLGHKKKAKEGMADITTKYIHLNDAYLQRATEYIQKIYTPKENK